jgi:hypothetical protein
MYMRNVYSKILIGIVILLWIIYFIQYSVLTETFTPRLRGIYRPYVRKIHNHYDTFVSNFGSNVIMNKLRKYDIY